MPSIKGYNVTVVDKDGDPIAVSASGKLETETTLDLSGVTIDEVTVGDITVLPPGSLGSGTVVATSTAGTLAPSTTCLKIDIMSDNDNNDNIYVGSSAITPNGSGGGVLLYPGDFYSLDIDNHMSKIHNQNNMVVLLYRRRLFPLEAYMEMKSNLQNHVDYLELAYY